MDLIKIRRLRCFENSPFENLVDDRLKIEDRPEEFARIDIFNLTSLKNFRGRLLRVEFLKKFEISPRRCTLNGRRVSPKLLESEIASTHSPSLVKLAEWMMLFVNGD